MVRAELNEKMDDIAVEMHGDVRAISTEAMYLVKMVGDQLEKFTGIRARTHIVNMCKLIVEDDMSMTQTMDLAKKTMDGEEVMLDELAAPDKITELRDILLQELLKYRRLRRADEGHAKTYAYDTGYIYGLSFAVDLLGKMIKSDEV